MLRNIFRKIFQVWSHHATRHAALSASVVVAMVAVAFALFGRPVFAQEGYITGIVADALASAISSILLWVASLLGKLLVVIIDIVIDIAQYNDFANAPVVIQGWSVVRDVANMFFVLVLLVIAFGTILKIDSYRYQRMLPKLVIMAVLINFSKLIATFFIDLSQVIMLTFVNAFADTAAANFTSVLKLRNLLNILPDTAVAGGGLRTGAAANISNWELVSVPLLANIMLIIAMMVMVVILVTLLVRMLALWILVVLSPLAYLASTMPMTSKYSGQWWSTFGKWLTTGPILAFFLWLSLAVLGSGQSLTGETTIRSGDSVTEGTQSTLSATLSGVSSSENLLGFMLGIAMLAISLSVANGLGGTAGRIAGQMGDKLKSAGSRTLKVAGAPFVAPVKWAGIGARELAKSQGRRIRRAYEDKAPIIMQPWNIYKGASERGAELDKMTRDVAQQKGREFWERATTGGAVKIPHVDRAEASIESQFAKDYSGMTKEEKAESARLLYDRLQTKPKDPELKRRMRALIRVSAEGGHLDDIMEDDYFRKQAKWTALDGSVHTGFEDKSARDGSIAPDGRNAGYYSRDKLNIFLRNALGGGKEMNDQQGLRLVYDLEEIGKKTKHEEYGGHSIYKTGSKGEKPEHVWLAPKDNSKALSEYKKGTGRQQLGASPHTFTPLRKVKPLRRDKDGNFKRDANGDFIVADFELDENGNYKLDKNGKKIPVAERVTGGRMTEFNQETFLATFRSQPAGKITEHSQVRTASTLLGGTDEQIDKESGAMVGDKIDKERIMHMLDEWYEAPAAFWKKIGGDGLLKFHEIDANGKKVHKKEQNVFDLMIENARQKGKTVDFNPDGSLNLATTDSDTADVLSNLAAFYLEPKNLGGKLNDKERQIAELYAGKKAGPGGSGTGGSGTGGTGTGTGGSGGGTGTGGTGAGPTPGGTPPPGGSSSGGTGSGPSGSGTGPQPSSTPPSTPPPPSGSTGGEQPQPTVSEQESAPDIEVVPGRTQSGGRERVVEGAEPKLPPEATKSPKIETLNDTIETLNSRLNGLEGSVTNVETLMDALDDGAKSLEEYSKKLRDQSFERHGPQAGQYAQQIIDPLVQRFNQLKEQQKDGSIDERLASRERLNIYNQMRRVTKEINDTRRGQGSRNTKREASSDEANTTDQPE